MKRAQLRECELRPLFSTPRRGPRQQVFVAGVTIPWSLFPALPFPNAEDEPRGKTAAVLKRGAKASEEILRRQAQTDPGRQVVLTRNGNAGSKGAAVGVHAECFRAETVGVT